MRRRSLAGYLAVAVAWVVAAGEVRGEDRCYAIIFGSQSHPKLLRYTHTWATFLKVSGESTDPGALEVYHHTISWLPASLDVRVWRPTPEAGVNLDLYQTLGYVRGNGESVTAWGPFQIAPETYRRSLEVRSILDSGQAQYRAISGRRDLLVSDCIHAVAAVDPVFGRGHYPLIRIGKPASRYVARQVALRSAFDQDRVEASWLIARLGLDGWGVEVVRPQCIPGHPCGLCRIPEPAGP